MPDTKISALTAGTALVGTEPIPFVQGGATVKTSPAAIKLYAETAARISTANALAALAIDVTKLFNTKSISTDSTFTFSATPATADTFFQLYLINTDTNPHLITIPSSFDVNGQATITTFYIGPGGEELLTFRYTGSGYKVFGVPQLGGMPPNSFITDKTFVITDANKLWYHPSSDNTARALTIPAGLPNGSAFTITNRKNNVTVAVTTESVYQAGTSEATSGTKTVAMGGMATWVRLDGVWYWNGVGVS